MIIVITVITKGISNDKPLKVNALEAKELSDALKCWEAFSQLIAIQCLPGMGMGEGSEYVGRLAREILAGRVEQRLWAAAVPTGISNTSVHKAENQHKKKEKGQVSGLGRRS